jgi:hypothetical protein
MAEPRCFRIHTSDNVATMLDDGGPGSVRQIGMGGRGSIEASEPIRFGHKIALIDIGDGRPIIKFGIPIGAASRAIRAGEWVHLHNCQSNYDHRSSTLDLQSGQTTDTRYE